MKLVLPRTKRALLRATLFVMLVLLFVSGVGASAPSLGYAKNAAFDSDSTDNASYVDNQAGNAFMVGRDVAHTAVEGDLYWIGQALRADSIDVGTQGGSFLALGQTLEINKANVQGSFRAIGQHLSLSNTTIAQNITAAGETITLDGATQANGLYVTGKSLDIAGDYVSLAALGDSLSLTAHIKGDALIYAHTLTITSDTQVEGSLKVSRDTQVVFEQGAQVPEIEWVDPLITQTTGLDPLATLVGPLLFSCSAHVLLAMLYWWLLKNTMRQAREATCQKLGKMLLVGLALFVICPFVALLLLALLVTAPIGILMLALMVLIWAFSIPFAGFVLGCATLPKLPERKAGIIGVLVMTILCYIPGLFAVIPSLCAIYTAGFIAYRLSAALSGRKKVLATEENGTNLIN